MRGSIRPVSVSPVAASSSSNAKSPYTSSSMSSPNRSLGSTAFELATFSHKENTKFFNSYYELFDAKASQREHKRRRKSNKAHYNRALNVTRANEAETGVLGCGRRQSWQNTRRRFIDLLASTALGRDRSEAIFLLSSATASTPFNCSMQGRSATNQGVLPRSSW